MALFDPCMEFEIFLGQMTSFEVLLKCHSLTLSKKCIRLHSAPSKCLSERINLIISIIRNSVPEEPTGETDCMSYSKIINNELSQ